MAKRKIINENRGFKGIWIPSYIWLNPNYTIQEIVFLAEIDSLDTTSKGCYASNKYFSDFFALSKNRCSEIIKSLEEKKAIRIFYEYNKENPKQIDKRIIRVVGKSNTPIRNIDEPIRNIDNPYSENLEDNNTLINNTENNTKPYMSVSEIPYQEIIDYLNEKANKRFKNTQKNKDLIKARWNEGQRLEDFKQVIDNMVANWTGKSFNGSPAEAYLRPSTLFSNKFDDYLNQVPKHQQEWSSDYDDLGF